MEKFKIPETARPFIDALRKIVATGISAAPDLESSPLLELDAVKEHAGKGANTHAKEAALVSILAELVKEGEPGALMGKDRDAAVRLFALHDWAGVPSRQRYDSVAKLYDKHWTWENFRKEPLDRHLFAIYLAIYRKSRAPVAPVARGEASQFDYKLHDYDLTYRLPASPGQQREEVVVRELEAFVDGVDRWRASSRYWGKSSEVGPDISLFGPGKLSIYADAPITGSGGVAGRAYITEVVFPEPLKKGRRIRFTLLKRQEVNFDDLVRDDWQDCQSITPAFPVDRASIRVCFPPCSTPKNLWQFEGLEDWQVPGVITEDARLMADPDNTIYYVWRDLRVGASSGLAWRW